MMCPGYKERVHTDDMLKIKILGNIFLTWSCNRIIIGHVCNEINISVIFIHQGHSNWS